MIAVLTIKALVNSDVGDEGSGSCNTAGKGSGDCNAGDDESGDCNDGADGSDQCNAGDEGSGDCNDPVDGSADCIVGADGGAGADGSGNCIAAPGMMVLVMKTLVISRMVMEVLEKVMNVEDN